MTLALALVLLGMLLMYAGIRGRSLRRMLLGDLGAPSALPEPVAREQLR